MKADKKRGIHRLMLALPSELVERIDDYRQRQRLPASRTAAIKFLLERGLEAEGEEPFRRAS